MNKYILVILVCLSSIFGMKIEVVSDSKEVKKEENFFMKNDRKVYRAMEPNIIKAMEMPIILAFEVEGKPVAPKNNLKLTINQKRK